MKKLFKLPYSLSLLAILFFSTLVRLFNLGFPSDLVFDETYHVPAIRLIAENDPRAFEWWHGPIYSRDNHDWLHPPLAKYIQAGFYNLGHGSVVSWRMGSVVFGLIGIILVYVLAFLVTSSYLTALLAALFLSLDGLWLVQSRVAMNDIFVSVFLLVVAISYWLFLQQKKLGYLLMTGLFLGLALATKWTAAFFVVGLLIFELSKLFGNKKYKLVPLTVFALLFLPGLVYFISYLPVLIQHQNFNFLVLLHKNIIYYQFNRDSLHLYQSVPWQWLFNLRSVWYWTNGPTQNIYLLNNPLLASFYVIALVIALVQVWQKQANKGLVYLLFFYVLSFGGWLLSPRILFYYHYLPAIPFLAIILATVFKQIYFNFSRGHNYIFLLVILFLILFFWLYYPLWTGLPVSQAFYQTLYWLLPSWK